MTDRRQRRTFDWPYLVTVLLLCIFGLVTIASATCDPYAPEGETGLRAVFSRIHWRLIAYQALWMATGIGLGFLAAWVEPGLYKQLAVYIFGFGMALLIAVLFMPAGRGNVRNAIYITEDLSFQPGELVKLCYVVMMAKLLSMREKPVAKLPEMIPFLVCTGLMVVLILAQREVGTALVYLFIFVVMMFVSGTSWKPLAILGGSGAVALVPIWFLLDDYQKDRILNFLDPTRDLIDSGLNVNYAKKAAASGGMFGKGLFEEGALSQLDYVPEHHTDFIYSVTVEAVGWVGGMLLLAALLFVVWRILRNARLSGDSFTSLVCVGIASMMLFHIIENVCMNIGLLPVTGIPLPFISYGGSSMWANLIGAAMVLGVSLRRKPNR